MDIEKLQTELGLSDFEVEVIQNTYGSEPEPILFLCFPRLKPSSKTRILNNAITNGAEPNYFSFSEFILSLNDKDDTEILDVFDRNLTALVEEWLYLFNNRDLDTEEDTERMFEFFREHQDWLD